MIGTNSDESTTYSYVTEHSPLCKHGGRPRGQRPREMPHYPKGDVR